MSEPLTFEAEARLRRARFVAEYWRDAYMALEGPARVGSHGLAMVLAALDGETDPRQLGIAADTANGSLFARLSGVSE